MLPYSVSKFALAGFSEGLHSEVKKDKIHITTVYPGLMRTGSHHNIDVLGDKQKEFGWFSIAGNNPLISVNAEKAASKIIDTIVYRKSSLIISLPANILAKIKGIFPAFTLEATALVNYALPSPTGEQGDKAKGFESHSSYSPSFLTKLGDRAAVKNNEL